MNTGFQIVVKTARGSLRMKPRYATRECAMSWLSFVKSCWHAHSAWVVKFRPPSRPNAPVSTALPRPAAKEATNA